MPATATAAEPRPITLDEWEAMPINDGVERWVIRGELREKPMTLRNRFHAWTEARIAFVLNEWRDRQPPPRGRVYSGEVGCRLDEARKSGHGIDVAYFSAATVAAQTNASTLMVGPPVVAVEVLSPNDTVEEIDEKVEEYLAAGVAHVWLVSTRRRTVTVHRPGEPTVVRNLNEDLTAEPDLPGFRVAVARLFED